LVETGLKLTIIDPLDTDTGVDGGESEEFVRTMILMAFLKDIKIDYSNYTLK